MPGIGKGFQFKEVCRGTEENIWRCLHMCLIWRCKWKCPDPEKKFLHGFYIHLKCSEIKITISVVKKKIVIAIKIISPKNRWGGYINYLFIQVLSDDKYCLSCKCSWLSLFSDKQWLWKRPLKAPLFIVVCFYILLLSSLIHASFHFYLKLSVNYSFMKKLLAEMYWVQNEICPLVLQSVENCISELWSSASDFSCHIGKIITVSVRCV